MEQVQAAVKTADIRIEAHGSVALIRPLTPAGSEWVFEHFCERTECGGDHQHWMGALVAEPRYVADIVSGATSDGLMVRES